MNRVSRWKAATVFSIACPAVAVAILILIAPAALAEGFRSAAAPRALAGAPGIEEQSFVAERGKSRFDRIGLHRIVRRSGSSGPGKSAAPVVLYLPGTNMNGEVAIEDPRYSLAVYLASRGADVWSMDYRTHFVPPEAPRSELKEFRHWTYDLFDSDVEEAARFVMERTSHGKIFVAGFSRGVTFAYLYAAIRPERVKGLVILDGFIAPRSLRSGRPGQWASDIGGRHLTYDKRKALLAAVIRSPDGPAPIPKFRTARRNLEHVVHDSAAFGGHGGLANPQGGFSDAVVLARVMIKYDRYWPAVQNFENPFTPERRKVLETSRIPVIAFSSTNIAPWWPAIVEKSAYSTGSSDVSVRRLKGWGHLDVLCGTKAEAEVYQPIARWLKRHQDRKAGGSSANRRYLFPGAE